jgi:hypothetical protein
MEKPREQDERLSFSDEPDIEPTEYPAEKARQGEIVLRHVWPRVIFFGALALIVIAGVIWHVLRL